MCFVSHSNVAFTLLACRFCDAGVKFVLEDFELGGANGEGASFEDACPESSSAFEKVFHSGGEDLVHPVARGTFYGSVKVGVADAEFFFDEGVEVDALGEDVAA